MMQQYPKVKDASASWLGSIPSHWDCKKVGSLFSERKVKVSDKDYQPLSVPMLINSPLRVLSFSMTVPENSSGTST